MAKLPLYTAGIAATFAFLLIEAAAEDAVLLKQAQEIFQPLPQRYGDNGVSDNEGTGRTR